MAARSGSACSTRCWSPALGIVLATMLGFVIGIARLSQQLAGGAARRRSMSRSIRNVPLLLQLLFWYNAVLKALPELRDSVCASGRRLSQQSRPVPAAAGVRGRASAGRCSRSSSASSRAIALRVWARRRQERTGAAGAGVLGRRSR